MVTGCDVMCESMVVDSSDGFGLFRCCGLFGWLWTVRADGKFPKSNPTSISVRNLWKNTITKLQNCAARTKHITNTIELIYSMVD